MSKLKGDVKRDGKAELSKRVQQQLLSHPNLQTLCQKMLQLVSLRQKQSGETPILVYNNIYVGNYWFASQEQYLRGHAIGLVVSCMEKPNIKQFSGIQYKEIPIRDTINQPLGDYVQPFYQWVSEQRVVSKECPNVYVHCFQGKSRSAAMIISYIMRAQDLGAEDAENLLKKRMPNCSPNRDFIRILKLKETQISLQRKKCQRDTNLIDLIGIEVESATVSNPISVQHSVFDSFAVATSGSVPDSVIDYIQGTADEMMPAPVSSIEPASISDSFMDSIPIPIDNWQQFQQDKPQSVDQNQQLGELIEEPDKSSDLLDLSLDQLKSEKDINLSQGDGAPTPEVGDGSVQIVKSTRRKRKKDKR